MFWHNAERKVQSAVIIGLFRCSPTCNILSKCTGRMGCFVSLANSSCSVFIFITHWNLIDSSIWPLAKESEWVHFFEFQNVKCHCFRGRLPALLFVAFGQSLAEAGVRTQVQRGLSLFVTNGQVCSVGCQEARDGCRTLFFCPLGAQAHDQLQERRHDEKKNRQRCIQMTTF